MVLSEQKRRSMIRPGKLSALVLYCEGMNFSWKICLSWLNVNRSLSSRRHVFIVAVFMRTSAQWNLMICSFFILFYFLFPPHYPELL